MDYVIQVLTIILYWKPSCWNLFLTMHQCCTCYGGLFIFYLSSMIYFKRFCLGQTIKTTKKLKKNSSNTDHFFFHYMFMLVSFVTSQQQGALLLHKHVYLTSSTSPFCAISSHCLPALNIQQRCSCLLKSQMTWKVTLKCSPMPHINVLHMWSSAVMLLMHLTLLVLFMPIKWFQYDLVIMFLMDLIPCVTFVCLNLVWFSHLPFGYLTSVGFVLWNV